MKTILCAAIMLGNLTSIYAGCDVFTHNDMICGSSVTSAIFTDEDDMITPGKYNIITGHPARDFDDGYEGEEHYTDDFACI